MTSSLSLSRVQDASLDRRGFTLFELLLVLVILLLVGGITFSNVQGLYQKKLLQEAAEAVRSELAAGRLYAIDTGVIYQFQYENGGTRYSLQPLTLAADASAEQLVRVGDLSDGMHFESRGQSQAANDGNSAWGADGTAAQNSADLTTMVLFSPDGTASDAVVDVVDSAERSLSISVRGLTAATSVGGMRHGRSP